MIITIDFELKLLKNSMKDTTKSQNIRNKHWELTVSYAYGHIYWDSLGIFSATLTLASEKTGSWKTWKSKRGKRTVCLVNSGVPTNLISEDDSYMYHNLVSYPFVCFPQFITCFIKSNLFAIDAKRNQVNNFVVTLHSGLITSK